MKIFVEFKEEGEDHGTVWLGVDLKIVFLTKSLMVVDFSVAHGCVTVGFLAVLEGLFSLFSQVIDG